MSHRLIAAELGYHEVSVGLVIRSAIAQEYLASRVADLGNEFHGQFTKVVRNIGTALDSTNPDVNLRASDMWLKAHGKYAPKSDRGGADGPVSAEDVVSKLLEHARLVQINIDNRRVPDGPPPASDDYSFLERSK